MRHLGDRTGSEAPSMRSPACAAQHAAAAQPCGDAVTQLQPGRKLLRGPLRLRLPWLRAHGRIKFAQPTFIDVKE